MLKKIYITLQVDTDESEDFIRKDIEQELNCCSLSYDIQSIKVNCVFNGRKPKRVYCYETGQFFNGLKEAAEWLHVSVPSVHQCCSGYCHTSGGYHICYEEDIEHRREESRKKAYTSSKPVYSVTLRKRFDSMKEAAEACNTTPATVSRHCRGCAVTKKFYFVN